MVKESLAKRFGDLVRRKRLEQGYSQEDFSFMARLHQTYISGIERGRRNVTLETADRIARALGTTLSRLLAEIERESPAPDKKNES